MLLSFYSVMYFLQRKTDKGFTLIELLVVIAIIGILASVVLASLGSARTKSRDTSKAAQIKEVKKAMEAYYLDNGAYPATADVPIQNFSVPTYMPTIPGDGSVRIVGNTQTYGLRIDFEQANVFGSDASGLCKTGSSDLPASWFGATIPFCDI